jgi:plastocyanin
LLIFFNPVPVLVFALSLFASLSSIHALSSLYRVLPQPYPPTSLAMFAVSFSLGLALLPFAAAAVHDVHVGGAGGKLVFDPEAIASQPGDQVVFHFHPKNHSVTQSSFADPCGPKEGGFDSGFMPVPANATDNFPTYTVDVKDTQPIWVYCRQASKTPASHCGSGMVFAINCGADGTPNSFTNFKKSALAVGASLSAAGASPTAPSTWTAAYGGYTIPPAPEPVPVTQTITLESSTWVTSYSSYPNSPAPTPASLEGTVHKVYVGGPGKLIFDPPHISAQPRDTVVFEFRQKNHTVTQSSFADPCRKLSANGVEGWDSGFLPVADDATTFPTWNITVNDTAPIWAYCRQKTPVSHCGSGMVFAINSDESSARNFTAFQEVAKQLNGTALAASAAPTSTTAAGNGAVSIRIGGAGLTLALSAVIVSLL